MCRKNVIPTGFGHSRHSLGVLEPFLWRKGITVSFFPWFMNLNQTSSAHPWVGAAPEAAKQPACQGRKAPNTTGLIVCAEGVFWA